jgi:hypothetical protein
VRAIPEVLGEYRVHSDGQYIQRVLTPEGLRRSVELQGVIADHFGISEAMLRNTLYTRNSFALAKLAETLRPQWVAYRRLATATALDSSFTPMQRVLLGRPAKGFPEAVACVPAQAGGTGPSGCLPGDKLRHGSQGLMDTTPGEKMGKAGDIRSCQLLGVRVHALTTETLYQVIADAIEADRQEFVP